MWCFAHKYESNVQLNGKTAIITGGNCGIGLQTAKDLYKRGARVLILCRDEKKALAALETIKKESINIELKQDILFKHLDLSDLSSVRKCAHEILQEEKQINYLINNAGVMTHPTRKSKDEFEIHLAVNYLGPFLLTLLLLPRIIVSAPARIVNVSSLAHQFPFVGGRIDVNDLNFENRTYRQLIAYGQSKLALIIFTRTLARKLKDAGINNVTTYSLHPGVIATELGRNFNELVFGFSWLYHHFKNALLLTPEQGASTTLYCLLDEKLANKNGLYYSNCKEKQPHRLVYDDDLAENLWKISKQYVKLESDNIDLRNVPATDT